MYTEEANKKKFLEEKKTRLMRPSKWINKRVLFCKICTFSVFSSFFKNTPYTTQIFGKVSFTFYVDKREEGFFQISTQLYKSK